MKFVRKNSWGIYFLLVLWLELRCFMYRENNGKCLYTCAVRPAAIYGPGEERHLPRIVSLVRLGLVPFKIGAPSVKTDWIYVDNLVLALVLASMGLLDDIPGKTGHPIAAGQPYFVSDGNGLFIHGLFIDQITSYIYWWWSASSFGLLLITD